MRYHDEHIHKIMPKDSIYISILREPGALFESTFRYFYGHVPEFQHVSQGNKKSIEYWLDHAFEYWNPKHLSYYGFKAKNHMIFDLGFKADLENETEINEVIQKLDARFDLILISDHLDESLVLLADLLGCSLIDISSVKINAMEKSEADEETSKRIKAKARRWNKADAALFDYFNKTLWKKVENYGFERMKKDVEKLKMINHELTVSCVNGNKTVLYSRLKNAPWKGMRLYQPRGVKITGYDLKHGALKNKNCIYLVAPEPYLSSKVCQYQAARRKQMYNNIDLQ